MRSFIIYAEVRCHVVYMGDMKNEFRFSVGNFELKRPFKKLGSAWKETIIINVKEQECEVLD
jgi:hypothetical protein